jgi:hypothetical protein
MHPTYDPVFRGLVSAADQDQRIGVFAAPTKQIDYTPMQYEGQDEAAMVRRAMDNAKVFVKNRQG